MVLTGEGPNGRSAQIGRQRELIQSCNQNAVIAVMVRYGGVANEAARSTEWSVLPVTATSQKVIAEGSVKKH